MMAPPEIPITNSAEAIFVNLPKPLKANGHKAGQITAFAKPRTAIHITDVKPVVTNAIAVTTIPKLAEKIM